MGNGVHAVTDIEVRAAGGVVWREGDGGKIEVLLVHRPRYDDWSFPKGKCEGDETDEACAIREVAEETGFVCEPGFELSPSDYFDRRGRAKRVRYWTMTVAGLADPMDGDEVDVLRWLRLADVPGLLTYTRDRPVFESFCTLVACDHLPPRS